MPRDLVQVMTWCSQASSHYLDQCCPRYPMLYASLGLNELTIMFAFQWRWLISTTLSACHTCQNRDRIWLVHYQWLTSGVGVTEPISSIPLFIPFFSDFSTLPKHTNITFIFDRCCCSSAVVTPVKYECGSKNIKGTFARWKILLMEKLPNRALVTPTLGWLCYKD